MAPCIVANRLLQGAQLAIGLGEGYLQLGAIEGGVAPAGQVQLVEFDAQGGRITVQADLGRFPDLLRQRHRLGQRGDWARAAAPELGRPRRTSRQSGSP